MKFNILLVTAAKAYNGVNNFLETEKEIAHFVKEAEMIPPLLHSYSDVIDSNSKNLPSKTKSAVSEISHTT